MNIYEILIYLIIILIFVWRITRTFKIGFVKEIANTVSIVIAIIIGIVLRNLVLEFMSARFGKVIAYLSVLAIILTIYKVVNIILKSLKIFTSLPVIKFINKILGAMLGAVEAIAIVLCLVKLLKDYVLML